MASPLDLDAVQAFVLVADCGSFTRAAALMDTSQAAISLKVKRLERRLACRLLERTPRHVRLSAQGSVFIAEAKKLLSVHEQAMASVAGREARRIKLGVSDYIADWCIPLLLSQLVAQDPKLVVEIRISDAATLKTGLEQGDLNAAVIRQGPGQAEGEVLTEDRLGWFASPLWQREAAQPLRVAMLAAPCAIRACAVESLEAADIAWTEAFVGDRMQAVGSAVSSGMAVAPMARRVATADLVEVGPQFGLPELPVSKIVLLMRIHDRNTRELLRAAALSFRDVV